MLITEKHVFFYKDWLSNFHRAPFIHRCEYGPSPSTVICTTSEQAYQYDKAMAFQDTELAALILRMEEPSDALLLGNSVRAFTSKFWDTAKRGVMHRAVKEKYESNLYLAKRLLDPKFDGKTFVEASPIDTYWGIGMAVSNPNIDDETVWQGENVLGGIITEIRGLIKANLQAIHNEQHKTN